MNKKFSVLLVAMLIMDIINDDFSSISVLDIVKIILYVLCFAFLICDALDEKKGDDE